MIDTLLEALPPGQLSECRVLFAGGIHDAMSASMVATAAAALAVHGVRIGVLMGTAYLFTDEAVAGGAIVETFRQRRFDASARYCSKADPATPPVAPPAGSANFFSCASNSWRTEARRTRFPKRWSG